MSNDALICTLDNDDESRRNLALSTLRVASTGDGAGANAARLALADFTYNTERGQNVEAAMVSAKATLKAAMRS